MPYLVYLAFCSTRRCRPAYTAACLRHTAEQERTSLTCDSRLKRWWLPRPRATTPFPVRSKAVPWRLVIVLPSSSDTVLVNQSVRNVNGKQSSINIWRRITVLVLLLYGEPQSYVCIQRYVNKPCGGAEMLQSRKLFQYRQAPARSVVEPPLMRCYQDLILCLSKGRLLRCFYRTCSPAEPTIERTV